MLISPVSGSIRRSIERAVVVLPQPLSPTRPRVSPFEMENPISSKARTVPGFLKQPRFFYVIEFFKIFNLYHITLFSVPPLQAEIYPYFINQDKGDKWTASLSVIPAGVKRSAGISFVVPVKSSA